MEGGQMLPCFYRFDCPSIAALVQAAPHMVTSHIADYVSMAASWLVLGPSFMGRGTSLGLLGLLDGSLADERAD
jgi:hypothetical protein